MLHLCWPSAESAKVFSPAHRNKQGQPEPDGWVRGTTGQQPGFVGE